MPQPRIWEVAIDDSDGNTRWFYTAMCSFRQACLEGLSREGEFMGTLSRVDPMPLDWTPVRED